MEDDSSIRAYPNLQAAKLLVRTRFTHKDETYEVIVVEQDEELAVAVSCIVGGAWEPADSVCILL